MADTTRTKSQLITLFADNTTGLITAQDARDFIVSAFPYQGSLPPSNNNDRIDSAGLGAFFDIGSQWLVVSTGLLWTCRDGTPGAAVWVPVTVTPTVSASQFYVGPSSGAPTSPTFRGLVPADFTNNGIYPLLRSTVKTGGGSTYDFIGGSAFSSYLFELKNVVPTGQADFQIIFSTDFGATWDQSSGSYYYGWSYVNTAGVGGDIGAAAQNQFQMMSSVGTSAGIGVSGHLHLNPGSATEDAVLTGTLGTFQGSTGLFVHNTFSGAYNHAGPVNGVRFKFPGFAVGTGNITMYQLP